MTKHAYFMWLSKRWELDYSTILDLERQEIELNGIKPSRKRLEELCRDLVDKENCEEWENE